MAWGLATALLAAAPAWANEIGSGLAAMPTLRLDGAELLLRRAGSAPAPCAEPDLAVSQRGALWPVAWQAACDDAPAAASSSWMAYASAAADLMPTLHAERCAEAVDARPELASGVLALAALATMLRLGSRRPPA